MIGQFSQLATVISGNLRLVVNIAVGLLVTRVMVREEALGLEAFGSVYFILQLGAIVTIVGLAFSGASARNITQSIAQGDRSGASEYLVNTLVSVTGLGILLLVLLNTYGLSEASFAERVPFGLMNLIIGSLVITAVGGVLSVGNFVREKFVSRALVYIAARLVYLALFLFSFYFLDLGLWSIGWGLLIAALISLISFHLLFRYLLPDIRLRLRQISGDKVLEVGGLVGWMLLAYLGAYLVISGTIFVVERHVSGYDLGRFALIVQIGSILLLSIQSLSVLTAPGIYRSLAVNKVRSATAGMERYLLLGTMVGGAATLCLAVEGENLLRIWLGEQVPPNMAVMLIGIGLSCTVAAWGSGVSVYLAGANQIRAYSIATFIEGTVVMFGAASLLSMSEENLVYVPFLPAPVGMLKYLLLFSVLERKSFALASSGSYLRKGILVLAILGASATSWLAVRHIFDLEAWWQTGIRVVCMGLPVMGYLAWRLLPQRSPLEGG